MMDVRTDSRELDELRFRFRCAHPRLQATPERLGMFAGARGITVTDMGRHSRRWITRYRVG